MSPASKIALLHDRAQMMQSARLFFAQREVLEVDCPALSLSAPIDLHIDVMHVKLKGGTIGYLHTSPEYGMKRLLAEGIGDIYQMSHVFRDGESSPLHNPEFTMVEWYRLSLSFQAMIEETLDFMRLFLGNLPACQMNYRELLLHFCNIDYLAVDSEALYGYLCTQGIDLPSNAMQWDKDTLLQLLLGTVIEPQLGRDQLFVLSSFPASQAALAKTATLENGEEIACRFEIYYKGMELANGYHELTDPIEQRKRLENANRARIEAGKEALPLDEQFLDALQRGLPNCCGVAVGFDRLMLLKTAQSELSSILPLHIQPCTMG